MLYTVNFLKVWSGAEVFDIFATQTNEELDNLNLSASLCLCYLTAKPSLDTAATQDGRHHDFSKYFLPFSCHFLVPDLCVCIIPLSS